MTRSLSVGAWNVFAQEDADGHLTVIVQRGNDRIIQVDEDFGDEGVVRFTSYAIEEKFRLSLTGATPRDAVDSSHTLKRTAQ